MAGLFPGGEVLFGDGAAGELVLEDLLDVGEAVKPLDDFGAGKAVFDALAELNAGVFGQASDFADVGHGIYDFGFTIYD